MRREGGVFGDVHDGAAATGGRFDDAGGGHGAVMVAVA
ncbi:hypothetical protein FHR81_004510 [Actinoalloteichus hoggarensis]|uniref:Uncharacterized protein n=1 Tax=Actinoalloteichus hoggarensis TaxID=1470176 RepID=A0A221W3G0_9PSEU|nr:hypothetical protein AHOG_13785 [Actinoalloteichus hoggarensis]MBB5923439.1 hypothetical protein [Actinoalloteichus hoggarensis]